MSQDSSNAKPSINAQEHQEVFAPGTLIVIENQQSRKLFIIQTGKVRVFKNYFGHKVTMAILGEGEMVGELSFLDGEPRSASVETLTEVVALVIDGQNIQSQIDGLPTWVMAVFKKVFTRFREMDRQLVSLQHISEFQKRAMRNDKFGQTLYLEVARITKTMRLIEPKLNKENVTLDGKKFLEDLSQILGKHFIGIKTFWRTLLEYGILEYPKVQKENLITINQAELWGLDNYVNTEMANERYLMLSHSAVAILRKLIHTQHIEGEDKHKCRTLSEFHFKQMPYWEQGLAELSKLKMVSVEKEIIDYDLDTVSHHYNYQSFLKYFDHMEVQID